MTCIVSSCVGPVVDVQVLYPQAPSQEQTSSQISTSDRNRFSFSALSKSTGLSSVNYIPAVYDAIIIQRDHWLHTEGFSLTSSGTKQSRQAFYDELQAFAGIIPFYESLSWALLALTGCFDSFRRTPNIHDEIISDLEDDSADDNSDSILVFATLFDI